MNSLTEAITARSILTGFDLSIFGDFADFSSLDPCKRDMIYLGQLPDGHFDLVCAHMSFATLKARFPLARRITIMREPRTRLISFYFHWRSHSEQELSLWGSYAQRMRLSNARLSDFLHSKEIACLTDNVFARFLLWPHQDIPENDFIDASLHNKLFKEAEAKLEDFDFVDILENRELEANFEKWLGLPFRMRKDHQTEVRGDLRTDLESQFDDLADIQLNISTGIDTRLWMRYAQKSNNALDWRSWSDGQLTAYKRFVAKLWGPLDPTEASPAPPNESLSA